MYLFYRLCRLCLICLACLCVNSFLLEVRFQFGAGVDDIRHFHEAIGLLVGAEIVEAPAPSGRGRSLWSFRLTLVRAWPVMNEQK